MSITEITAQLADVQRRLLELPVDAFAERHRLLTIRDRLREEASRHRRDPDLDRSDEELLAELAARRSQLRSIEAQRIDMVKQSGGGSGASAAGADGWGGVVLNQQIDAAHGRAEVASRIGRLTSLLADRGVEIPDRR